MNPLPDRNIPRTSSVHHLLAYIADLELEVDRLRKHSQVTRYQVRETIMQIRDICLDADEDRGVSSPLKKIEDVVYELISVLHDLHDPPGFHPAHDRVISLAIRPVAEQVFRSQRRLEGVTQVVLRLQLESESLEWFPARLRHILENLFSNSLKFRDSGKAEQWVELGLRVTPNAYEVRVSDNGTGMPTDCELHNFDLFYRAAPVRNTGLILGLTVVKMLVEQSGGMLTVNSGDGEGTTVVATLPRYDVSDFLV